MDHILKTKKELKNLKKLGTQNIYTELGKTCFQHDMAYEDFKDLAKRTVSDKILKDKAFSIATNPKYDRSQRGLGSMVYKCFDKKSAGGYFAKNEIKQNLQLAEGLHRPIIRNLKKEQFILDLKTIFGMLI